MKISQKALFLLSTTALSFGLCNSGASAQGTPTGPSADDSEVVIITGIRGSQRSAIKIKKDDDRFSDSIVAEDIGKLPDVTIADSLQRVTGVQIQREAGEGGRISLRGMPNVLTTINNEVMLSATNITSTEPNYADLPSQLIASSTVYKSMSAELLGGGVAGVVEMRTRKPLDLKPGFNLAGSLERSYGSKSEAANYNGSVFAGYRSKDKRWGIIVTAAATTGENSNFRNNFDNNSYDLQTDATAIKNPIFNISRPQMMVPTATVNNWVPEFYDFRGDGKGPETCPGYMSWQQFLAQTKMNAQTSTTDGSNNFNRYNAWVRRNNIACANAGDFVLTPRMLAFNYRTLQRDREAFNISGSYKVTDKLTATAELFSSKIEDYDPQINMFFHNDGQFDRLLVADAQDEYQAMWNATFAPGLNGVPATAAPKIIDPITNPVVGENGVVEYARQRATRILTRGQASRAVGEAFNSSYSLDYKGTGPLSWNARLTVSNNSRDTKGAGLELTYSPLRTETCAPGIDPEDSLVPCSTNGGINPGYDMSFDIRDGIPKYVFYDGNLAANKQAWNGFSANGSNQEGDLQALSLSGQWKKRYFIVDTIKFGARASVQNFTNEGYTYLIPDFTRYPGQNYSNFFNPTNIPDVKTLFPTAGYTPHPLWLEYPNNNGVASNYEGWTKEYTDFAGQQVPGGLTAIPNVDLLEQPHQFIQQFMQKWETGEGRTYQGGKFYDPVNDYQFEIKNQEAYLQFDFSGELPILGWDYKGNTGLRYVENKHYITQNKVDFRVEGLNRPHNDLNDPTKVLAPATGSCYFKVTRYATQNYTAHRGSDNFLYNTAAGTTGSGAPPVGVTTTPVNFVTGQGVDAQSVHNNRSRNMTINDPAAKDPNNLVPCLFREFPGAPLLKSLGKQIIENSTNEILPSFNIRLSPTRNLAVRASWHKSTGRTDLGNMARGTNFSRTPNNGADPTIGSNVGIFISQSSGNPNLTPFKATISNLGAEWYPDQDTLVQAAIFNLHVDAYPTGVSGPCLGPDDTFLTFRLGSCNTQANGKNAYLRGFEVGVKKPLNFLPGAWSGFGFDANYTLSESGNFGRKLDAASLPPGADVASYEAALEAGLKDVEGNFLPISQFSKHVTNFTLWYQKYGLQARLAYNWRSERYDTIRQVTQSNGNYTVNAEAAGGLGRVALDNSKQTQRFAVWADPQSFVDGSISYDVNKNFTVILQGSNLTENYERKYAQYPNLFRDVSEFDRRITLGVRYRNK